MDIFIFDSLLYQFETIFSAGVPAIKALITATFWSLATIDVALAYLMNLEDGDHIKITIQKCLKIGMWLFLINNWGSLCTAVKDSLIAAGTAVGTGASLDEMMHPSQIVTLGITKLSPIITYIQKFTGMDVLYNLPMIATCIIGYFCGCLAFIIVGIQVFITYVEFYLVCALFTVFVPFGVTKWTSFLAEKAMGGVIAYGVKLMVMACILGIITPIITAWTSTPLTPDNALTCIIGMAAAPLLLAFLSWHSPALAASAMTGGPSLSAGSLMQTAVGAGIAAAGAGALASGGVSKAASALGVGGGSSSSGDSGGKSSTSDAASSLGDSGNSGGGNAGGNSGNDSSSGGESGSPQPQFSGGGSSSFGAGASATGGIGAMPTGGSSPTGGVSAAAKGVGGSIAGSVAGGALGKAAGAAAGGPVGAAVGGIAGGVVGGEIGESAATDTGSSTGNNSETGSSNGSASAGAGGSAATSSTGGASNEGTPSNGTNAASGSGQNMSGSNVSNENNSTASGSNSVMPTFSSVIAGGSVIKGAIPQEASPKGGISVPLPKD